MLYVAFPEFCGQSKTWIGHRVLSSIGTVYNAYLIFPLAPNALKRQDGVWDIHCVSQNPSTSIEPNLYQCQHMAWVQLM